MVNLWMSNKDIQEYSRKFKDIQENLRIFKDILGYSRIFTKEKIMLAFHYRSTPCYSRHVFGSKAI